MSDRMVESRLKDLTACPCGCGQYGRLAVGTGHVRSCPDTCPKCRGKRNRNRGLAKQRAARKQLGVPGQKFGDSNEERWGDNVFANEVKSGRLCGPAANVWAKIEAQVLANRADHGDRRLPCRAVLMPEGWGEEGLVLVRLSTWRELIRPALDEFYGPEGGRS